MTARVTLYKCRLMEGRTLITLKGCDARLKQRARYLMLSKQENNRQRGKWGWLTTEDLKIELLKSKPCVGCPGAAKLGEA